MIPPGIILVIPGLVLLAYVGSLTWFLVVAVLYGFGYGIVQPTLNTLAISMSPPERRGGANAIFNSALDIGIGLGAMLWGVTAQLAGFTLVYLVAAGCVGIALLMYFLILSKRISIVPKTHGMENTVD
jgi:MFS family permease